MKNSNSSSESNSSDFESDQFDDLDCIEKDHSKSNGKRICTKTNLRKNSLPANHLTEFRSENSDMTVTKNSTDICVTLPKVIDKVKRENQRSVITKLEFNSHNPTKSPKTSIDEKLQCNGDIKKMNTNIKKEFGKVKIETGNDEDDINTNMKINGDEITNIRKKRPSSANSSPYKDKKRKKILEEQPQITATNHDRIDSDILPPPPHKPVIAKVYYSYFERANDDKEELKEMK